MSNPNQKIKIILSYYHNEQTIMVPIYKNLSYVKDKVFDIFYPISGELNLIHKGINLNDCYEKPLGVIFPDQSIIKINIIKSKKNNLINSQSSIYKIYKKKKLPPITIKSRTKSPKVKSNKILCYECFKEPSFIFCRECNKFLCNNCALNKKSYHIEHKNDFLTLIPNSNRANIKQYKNTHFLPYEKGMRYKKYLIELIENDEKFKNNVEYKTVYLY